MIYTKNKDGSYQSTSGDKSVTLSEYNKATITYDTLVKTPITEEKEVENTIVDAYGKTIVLGTKVVQVPVMETIKVKELNEEGKEHTVKKEQASFKEEIVQVKYNPYDGYVIIPDDATVLTEAEYNKELEELQSKSQEIFESTNNVKKK